jgi:hypothetical protein
MNPSPTQFGFAYIELIYIKYPYKKPWYWDPTGKVSLRRRKEWRRTLNFIPFGNVFEIGFWWMLVVEGRNWTAVGCFEPINIRVLSSAGVKKKNYKYKKREKEREWERER